MDAITFDATTQKVLLTLFTAVLALFKYTHYRTRLEKMRLVRRSFEAVVTALASSAPSKRMSAAILLRRFFDSTSEVGKPRTPFEKEALSVAAAMLRVRVPRDLQKLLADGLAFAPTLAKADLQKTNLQNAYLGSRAVLAKKFWFRMLSGMKIPLPKAVRDRGTKIAEIETDLRYADFYRADLSNASLKRANATNAVFYQTRLNNTVLSGADLRGANFFQADLKDAVFKNTLLLGANFRGTRNIPPAIAENLSSEWQYLGNEPFTLPEDPSPEAKPLVFISKPGIMSAHQSGHYQQFKSTLLQDGLEPKTLERAEYPSFGAIVEVRRILDGCAGAVIFGFSELCIRNASWRSGTAEEKEIENLHLATPWSHIEAAMAITLGIPVYIMRDRKLKDGVFEMDDGQSGVYHAFVDDDTNTEDFLQSYSGWTEAVRERNRRIQKELV